ncbi:MAG: septation regulator SpoVG [Fusobacteria bacterium]|nr:septation regulator SpoVG [Fusobacteriota bacterium]
MKISDVRVRIARNESDAKLRAYVDITLEDCFVIHGLKVIEGKNGKFVAMPSRKMPNGEYKDIAHPIFTDIRNEITNKVLEKYEEVAATVSETEIFTHEE